MGKKQHSKDRLFITRSEWNAEWGGYKEKKTGNNYPLPFYCCSLSLQPFEHPYCTQDGYIFDLTSIMPHLNKSKTHPITGKPLNYKDLIKLKFHQNEEEDYHCPITKKVFNENSHIVAIKPTGNVYSFNAIKNLNIANNEFIDLIDNKTSFNPKTDIIHLRDPKNKEKYLIQNFKKYHVSKNSNNNNNGSNSSKSDKSTIVQHSLIGKRIWDEVQKETMKSENDNKSDEPAKKRIKLSNNNNNNSSSSSTTTLRNAYRTGRMAASFTSTAMPRVTSDEFVPLSEAQLREVKWRKVKGNHKYKAFVRMITNLGNLNIQIDCDLVPMTSMNFLMHCASGYYNNTIFHRNISSFMIQGGDPTGTGHGGECAWDHSEHVNKYKKQNFGYKMDGTQGKKEMEQRRLKRLKNTFGDEFNKLLKHDERGILSMANSGPDTNGSQFFITYAKCSHLDGKHSVFGRIVGGMATLNQMELVPTDKSDKPLKQIKIIKCLVYNNPFDEVDLNGDGKDDKKSKTKEKGSNKSKEKGSKDSKDGKDGKDVGKEDEVFGHWWSDPTNKKSDGNASENGSENGSGTGNRSDLGVGKYLKLNLEKMRKEMEKGSKGKHAKEKKRGDKKKRRNEFLIPLPKTQNDSIINKTKDKGKDPKTSVFRFKDFANANK